MVEGQEGRLARRVRQLASVGDSAGWVCGASASHLAASTAARSSRPAVDPSEWSLAVAMRAVTTGR